MLNTMTDDVIGNYLDTLKEREFDAPFMTLLRAHGYWDIHFTHGKAEFGKDFIAKREEDGQVYQFAFQSKAGNLATEEWRKVRYQIDLLRTDDLSHPAFDLKLPRRAILVMTGRLTGNAPIEAQQYQQRLERLKELQFTLWDKETIVEMMSRSPETGLSGKAEGELFGLIGKIDENKIQDNEIERFSRRWFEEKQRLTVLWKSALETAVVANRLRQHDRLDLACYASLCLVRAAWICSHSTEPPDKISLSVADTGRHLFRFYAGSVGKLVKG